MIGKKVLIGLTYVDTNNEVTSQLQLYGNIISIGDHTLVFQRSDNGNEFSIPFDGDLDESDPESIYTLKATGEEVTGVHYISTFTIHQSEENAL